MSEAATTTTDLPSIIREHLDAIVALARAYEVERLEVFGSVMTDRFDPDRSDIDFLVTYPEDYEYGPFLARFQYLERDLGEAVERDVDLVMNSPSLRERFRRSIASTRQVLYAVGEDS
ncbi:MAG: nucleotidyltransferase domain-containing protein [Thermomicrobiales bacterium]